LKILFDEGDDDYNSFVTLSDYDSNILNILEVAIERNFNFYEEKFHVGNYCRKLDVNVQYINWELFRPPWKNTTIEIVTKNTMKSGCIIGSALCYMSQHDCVADVIHYYFHNSGINKAVICQIGDRDGLQQFLARLTALHLNYTVSEVSSEVYESAACAIYCQALAPLWNDKEINLDSGNNGNNNHTPQDDFNNVKMQFPKRFLFDLPVLCGKSLSDSANGVSNSNNSTEKSQFHNHLLRTKREAFIIVTVIADSECS